MKQQTFLYIVNNIKNTKNNIKNTALKILYRNDYLISNVNVVVVFCDFEVPW